MTWDLSCAAGVARVVRAPPGTPVTRRDRVAAAPVPDTLTSMHAKALPTSLRTATWYVGYFYFTDFSEGRARA
jgi:hypothetical protein